MGLTVPFLGGDGLDQPSILGLPGNAADGVFISTVYCPEAEDERVRVFKSRFYERYKCYPDVWAVQGYDAVRLLCSSFIGAKSTIPSIVSSYMHFLVSGHGVMGDYSFTNSGDIVGKKTYFKQVRNGQFHYLQDTLKDR